MDPPWVLDPEQWSSKWWIVTQGNYLDRWRDWFCGLSEIDQESYRAKNVPPLASAQFYEVFGRPKYDPALEAEKYRDRDGNLTPPWIAMPQIPLGSIGWRMVAGEDYWHEFASWYQKLRSDQKAALQVMYPEPIEVETGYPWTGFYGRLEK